MNSKNKATRALTTLLPRSRLSQTFDFSCGPVEFRFEPRHSIKGRGKSRDHHHRHRQRRLFYLTRATSVDGHYFIGITVDISSRFKRGEKREGRGLRKGRPGDAGVRCGVRSALPGRALSAPPLIAVFVVAPTISLPPTPFRPLSTLSPP